MCEDGSGGSPQHTACATQLFSSREASELWIAALEQIWTFFISYTVLSVPSSLASSLASQSISPSFYTQLIKSETGSTGSLTPILLHLHVFQLPSLTILFSKVEYYVPLSSKRSACDICQTEV